MEQYFGGFFQKIKVCQPIGRKDSIQAVCQRMKRLEAFLYSAAYYFELFSKFMIKIEPLAVDILSKAYPMIPVSCRSNLAGLYLQGKGSTKVNV